MTPSTRRFGIAIWSAFFAINVTLAVLVDSTIQRGLAITAAAIGLTAAGMYVFGQRES